jgi:hypothetical protein
VLYDPVNFRPPIAPRVIDIAITIHRKLNVKLFQVSRLSSSCVDESHVTLQLLSPRVISEAGIMTDVVSLPANTDIKIRYSQADRVSFIFTPKGPVQGLQNGVNVF